MFISYNKVRMHDTDMAGVIFFANQFRFVHDALEDFLEAEGISLHRLFNEHEFVFVIVHAEADYLKPLKVGDPLEVHVGIEKIGESSLSINYIIFRNSSELVGRAKTVHVCLAGANRQKTRIPSFMREAFAKHLLEKAGS